MSAREELARLIRDGEGTWRTPLEAADAILAATGPPTSVLSEVGDERTRQDAKWGEQNHPDGTGPDTQPLDAMWWGFPDPSGPFEENTAKALAEAATATTDRHATHGVVTFADILLEEVFEALAESDLAKLRIELIQVAAVATQWAEAIDRREVGE